MKITFLHHSSFLVELSDTLLLFDYFHGDKVKEYAFSGILPELPKEKAFYLFASHKHRDHFDMDNLKLADQYPNIHFVFAKDCKLTKNFLTKHGYGEDISKRITYVSPTQEYQFARLSVKTLRSTDAGVAYLVNVDGKHFYHGGDLNWWHWQGQKSTENENMAAAYKKEIDKLQGEHFDVAFVPLDSRQHKYAFLGFDYFLQNVSTEHIIPMHMWQDYSYIQKYKDFADDSALTEKIIEITQENQELII